MRTLCRLLLRLSPSRFRRDFSDEILDIFSTRLHEEGRSLRFVLKEIAGLVGLAWSMRPTPAPGLPIIGGLALAAFAHLTLYTILGALLRAQQQLLNPLNRFSNTQGTEPVIIGLYVMFCFIALIPLFLLLAFRIRRARTPRSLKVV